MRQLAAHSGSPQSRQTPHRNNARVLGSYDLVFPAGLASFAYSQHTGFKFVVRSTMYVMRTCGMPLGRGLLETCPF